MDIKDVDTVYTKSEFCNSCLSCENVVLQKYSFHNATLIKYFQGSELTLCQLCRRVAEQSQSFVQNVENIQKLFGQVNYISLSTLTSAKNCVEPIANWSPQVTVAETLGSGLGEEEVANDDGYHAFSHNNARHSSNDEIKEIKQEIKIEITDTFDEDFMNDDLHNSAIECVKEDELVDIIKKELLVPITPKYKCSKKKHSKSNTLKTKIKKENKKCQGEYADKIQLIHITEKECMVERLKMAADEKYLNLPIKCTDCIKGFALKSTYENHMEKHNKSRGKHSCNICKQMFGTLVQLQNHKKKHKIRYKCLECNAVSSDRSSIRQHILRSHQSEEATFCCQYCNKIYKHLVALRKHIHYSHSSRCRVTCDYCQKSFSNKDSLKMHMINIHSSEPGVEKPKMKERHICHCGKSFMSRSVLKKHELSHSDQKEYYCVECDKSFKSDTSLQTHLKSATPHVNYSDLHFKCGHCEKRFRARRDMQRHTNSVHLNVKPYQCDRCERAYLSKWSLSEHIRLIHEGYKRPLIYPCSMCDKLFDRKHILKVHLRTHTGERPYQCTKCPANFSQSSILHTHIKLIHLKLTRDGKSKRQ